MKKLVKFEKNDCNPCAMVSDLLDKKGVEYERINFIWRKWRSEKNNWIQAWRN